MWILAHIRADIRVHFVAKNFPCGRKNGAPGFATPLAPSKSGAYSELFMIRKRLKTAVHLGRENSPKINFFTGFFEKRAKKNAPHR